MDVRIEMRKKDFKKTFDDPRRRREEQQVQIRKQNREARMSAKRQQALAELETDESASLTMADIASIPSLVASMTQSDPLNQFQACQQFRKLLSIEKNPPIQEVIDAQVVPKLVEFLQDNNRPDIQFEAAWALTNIASGTQEQTKVVIDHGALPIFIQLLSSPKADVREQAVWALGNIAGDCAALRDMVFSNGGLAPLIKQISVALNNPVEKTSMLRNAAWTLSNLCRGKPRPKLEWVAPALPILKELIYTTDVDVLTDSCWALSYLSDGNDAQSADSIEAVLEAGVANRLVQLLCHPACGVQTPALRTVGNIVSGNEAQTQTMVSVNCVPALRVLISSSRKVIRKEACWTISNITAGTPQQIQAVLQDNIIPILVGMASPETEFDIRKEVYWALANAASGATPNQVNYLVSSKIIPPLADVLDEKIDLKLVAAALEGLNNIFSVGKQIQAETMLKDNPYVTLFEQANGYPKLENLQLQPENTRVYQFTMKLIRTFLMYEEESDYMPYEEENIPASPIEQDVTEQLQFNFREGMESQ